VGEGEIAAQRGWRATGDARAIVLTGTAANRARAERFGATAAVTLEAVPPQGGRDTRRWPAHPDGPNPAALWFVTDSHVMTTIKRRRIRRGRIAGSRTDPTSIASVTAGASR
jgi:hypothetical protein